MSPQPTRLPRIRVPLATIPAAYAKWLAPHIGVRQDEAKAARATPGMGRSVWYETPIDDTWMAAYRLARQSGHVVVAELRVFPLEPERPRWSATGAGLWSAELLGDAAQVPRDGLSARVLRKARMGEHSTMADEALEGWRALGLLEGFSGLGDTGRRTTPTGPTRGRPGHPPLHYARLARTYATAVARQSPRPTEVVAARHRLTVAHARDLIHKARVRGFLTTTSKGRLAGALTPKAKALLGIRPSQTKRRGR
jgi:hypothetical protein